MTQKELDFIEEFIVKLNVKIDSFYGGLTGEGIYLIEGFTDKQRRLDVEKAFKIIAKERSKNENH